MLNTGQFRIVLKIILLCPKLICIKVYIQLFLVLMDIYSKYNLGLTKWMNLLKKVWHLTGLIKNMARKKFKILWNKNLKCSEI